MNDEQIKEIIVAMLSNGKIHGKINEDAANTIVEAYKILSQGTQE